MAYTTSAKEVKPQALQSSAKQVSIEMDMMDPLAWNLDASPEDLELFGNVVELENDEIADIVEVVSNNNRKRAREDEEEPDVEDGNHEHTPPPQQDEITPSSVSLEDDPQDAKLCNMIIAIDRRPRVSRRKKKPNSFPKRPLGPYGIFYHRERQRIVESMTEGSLSEDDIQRQVGKLWRTLPEEEIKKYEELAEQDKMRYQSEMEAFGQDHPPSKKEEGGLEADQGCYAYDLPPPPPGVVLIPASGTTTGTDANSVTTAAGTKEAAPSSSPVPPHSSLRWAYGPPPAAHCPPSYPSPVPCTSDAPHAIHSPYHQPRQDYYPPAVPPSPRPWASPPSPYQPPPTGSFPPHFGGRPAPVYVPPPPRQPGYTIPPGMELALPTPSGGERKYRVTYKCYKMRAEDVQGFLDSMNARIYPTAPPQPHHHPAAYGHAPPRW